MKTNSKSQTTGVPPERDLIPLGTDIVGSYIGSSVEYGFLQTDRALPQSIDDAERDYGPDIYERQMMQSSVARRPISK